MDSAAPVEFDGPGDRWSPEHLIVAAVADCYAITFQGIARRSKLPFESLTCRVEGTLDRLDNVTRFTRFTVRPCLQLADEAHVDLARRILVRAEETCLIRDRSTRPSRSTFRSRLPIRCRSPSAREAGNAVIPGEFLVPYVVADAAALVILSLALWKPAIGRWCAVAVFLWAAVTNARVALQTPGAYVEYATLTPFALYGTLSTAGSARTCGTWCCPLQPASWSSRF